MPDETPARIRWHEGPATSAVAFAGTVGTVAPSLFGVFKPWESMGETDHTLTTGLPGMGSKRFFGTEEEVKAEAERWLTEFACSLGAVFPDVTLWGVRYDGPGGVIQRYSEEADARQAKREVESLRPGDKPAVMTRQTWAGEWKEANHG